MADVIWPAVALAEVDQITAYVEVFDPEAADRLKRLIA